MLLIVRLEMLYFIPQMQTKIVNEGWASYWHVRIMRELGLDEDEYVQFSRMHSGVLAPSRQSMNPYHVGYRMLEDIDIDHIVLRRVRTSDPPLATGISASSGVASGKIALKPFIETFPLAEGPDVIGRVANHEVDRRAILVPDHA